MASQIDLFARAAPVPGLRLIENAIDAEAERAVAEAIDAAPLEPFRFGQWRGKRLTANYGSAYDYQRGAVTLGLRQRRARGGGRERERQDDGGSAEGHAAVLESMA